MAAPDEELLGKAQGYPTGTRTNWFFDETVRVGSFTHLDTILPYNTLKKAEVPSPLKRATAEPELRYHYEGRSYTIEDYLQHQRVMGLLIIKDGEILVERYQYDRKPTDKFVSHSMAKSITSLAVGFALEEGRIQSLDDPVASYVPPLRGYAYGETSIRHVLRMASGVKFREDYDGTDDLSRFLGLRNTQGAIAALQAFGDREAEAGTRFHYASSETVILGVLVRTVTGKTLSDYLSEKLWRPMGAEADATWSHDPQGLESALGNFNAVLHDYGRLGVLLANDGIWEGRQLLPQSYVLEATDWHKHPEAFAPQRATPRLGYGYQFWIFPGEKRRFALLGVYGQAIYVDPALKLVLVHTAAAKSARIGRETMGAELGALWYSLVNTYGHW
jgi:CubicO group peptidase (beta-lactamase class C family)